MYTNEAPEHPRYMATVNDRTAAGGSGVAKFKGPGAGELEERGEAAIRDMIDALVNGSLTVHRKSQVGFAAFVFWFRHWMNGSVTVHGKSDQLVRDASEP